MEKFILRRSIKDALGESEVKDIQVKEEADISADDFLDVIAIPTGANLKDAVCNITGLTGEQVGSLHPSDYNKLAGLVGKFIGEE